MGGQIQTTEWLGGLVRTLTLIPSETGLQEGFGQSRSCCHLQGLCVENSLNGGGVAGEAWLLGATAVVQARGAKGLAETGHTLWEDQEGGQPRCLMDWMTVWGGGQGGPRILGRTKECEGEVSGCGQCRVTVGACSAGHCDWWKDPFSPTQSLQPSGGSEEQRCWPHGWVL